MRSILYILIFILFQNHTFGQNFKIEFEKAEILEKNEGALPAIKIYESILKQDPKNEMALQKIIFALSRYELYLQKKKLQNRYIKILNLYVNTLIKLYPNNDKNLYLKALTLGVEAQKASIYDKIRITKPLELYIKKCRELNPNNKLIYHLLGKFYYEISQLSSIELKVAKSFFGNRIPENSLQKSIDNFKHCYELNPTLLVNLSDYSLALHKAKEDQKAKYFLEKVLILPNTFKEDDYVKSECKALLKVIKN